MEEIYQGYIHLTAEQLKLLCFLAYTGKTTNNQIQSLYTRGESMTFDHLHALLRDLNNYLKKGYYYYGDEFTLLPLHYGPLLVYLLCEHPDWLRDFERKYHQQQAPFISEMIPQLRLCIMGRYETTALMMNDITTSKALVALASHKAFLPYLKTMSSLLIPGFVNDAVMYQLENDIDDPDGLLTELARHHFPRMMPAVRNDLHTFVALYDYYKRGVYNITAAALDTLYAHLLCGMHALYASKYEVAFKQLTLAIREKNRDSDNQYKGFFNLSLNNYILVMAYHFFEGDQHKKLAALLNKEMFVSDNSCFAPASLALYLLNGTLPRQSMLESLIKRKNLQQPIHQYFLLLIAHFFGLEVTPPNGLPPQPHLHFLRHELSSWLQLTDEERLQLETEFGGKPLLSRIRFKQPWELLLEELTPKDENDSPKDESQQQVRVCYVVNYDRVELREQKRLKSGLWGAGKRLPIDTFRRGTDFMDDADRKIAASIHNWYSYDIDVSIILPHLVGSDRVYTGTYAPLEPVAIVEEKPYLIIQRSKTGFSVKSNMGDVNLDKSTVFRKQNKGHLYTLFTITDQQRLYYKKLLQIGVFPLEAEPLLRQFLPKVSNVVEVHSDLVEGGSTLAHRDGSPILCLQVTPTSGTRNMFTVFCVARPLPDGVTLFDPGTGLNPCVAEAGGTRYQVTRDMRSERENLQMLRTFIDDNSLLDNAVVEEPFADRHPVIFSAEALLQTMLFVQEHHDRFAMEWPEGGQLHLKTANPSTWNIGLKSKNGWFEVEGEVPIDEETILTASELLQLVGESKTKGFVRLGEGQFMAITDRLRKQLERLESLATSNRGHLQISELHASLLDSVLDGDVTIRHDERIGQLKEKIEQSMQLKPATPQRLKAQLRDYQQDGYQWMCRMTSWGAGVCLADDMGLGKTIQTIAFLLQSQSEGPALVAAPASVVLNWRRELERFAPSLNVIILNTATDRHQAISTADKGDVVLTTYGLFVTESEHLQEKAWNTVCLDEAHVIKNRETKTLQAVMQLKATHRIILTGTPVQNHLGELWNLYQFINPGLLGSYDQFSQKYIIPIEQQDDKERSRQLKRIIQPFILRRTKQEVIEELPDKTEIIMPVELSQEEMAIYEVIRQRAKEMLEKEAASNPSVNTLAEITHLRQAACAAQLAEKQWTGGDSSKITVLLQLLEEIVGGGNSVLVFSQFTSFLALIRQQLDKSDISYAYLDGSVPMRQRDQLVQDFQSGRQQVFLISLKAGGLGLNLTGANYVIHMDPWWNPAIEQQATDRAYRIGQRQNVTVYHLIAQHTIEEKILRLHETKRHLADAMLEGTSQSHKLSTRDLLDMIGG